MPGLRKLKRKLEKKSDKSDLNETNDDACWSAANPQHIESITPKLIYLVPELCAFTGNYI